MKYTTFVEIIIQRIGQYVNDDTYQVPVISCFMKRLETKVPSTKLSENIWTIRLFFVSLQYPRLKSL